MNNKNCIKSKNSGKTGNNLSYSECHLDIATKKAMKVSEKPSLKLFSAKDTMIISKLPKRYTEKDPVYVRPFSRLDAARENIGSRSFADIEAMSSNVTVRKVRRVMSSPRFSDVENTL